MGALWERHQPSRSVCRSSITQTPTRSRTLSATVDDAPITHPSQSADGRVPSCPHQQGTGHIRARQLRAAPGGCAQPEESYETVRCKDSPDVHRRRSGPGLRSRSRALQSRCIARTGRRAFARADGGGRSEEHTSELQSLAYLVCRLLLEKKKK